MGWNNYIVVPKLRLLIKTSRYTCLDTFTDIALNRLFDDIIEHIRLEEIRLSDLNIKDLTTLVNNNMLLCEIDTLENIDSLLLYWLKSKDIDHNILNENDADIEEYRSKGYTII